MSFCAGEMIVGIEIPRSAALKRSHYLKVRDRASYEFAAASAAVGIEMEADGKTIRDVRIAIGGVATKPWRVRAVEDALKGKPPRRGNAPNRRCRSSRGCEVERTQRLQDRADTKGRGTRADDGRRYRMTQNTEFELDRRTVMKLGVGCRCGRPLELDCRPAKLLHPSRPS